MNIRRFLAPDMRAALRTVRETLGADAVMLSSRGVPEGVEVIAAVDYDDSLLTPALRATAPEANAAPAATAAPSTEYQRVAAALADASLAPAPVASAPVAPRAAVARTAERASAPPAVAAELQDLRRLLEEQLASLAWSDVNRRDPARARVLRQFARLGIDAPIAKELAVRLPKATSSRDLWRLPLQHLAERLMLANRELTEIGGIFAVVGPTGVGKTTTIAKMAARFALRHGPSSLALVSTDNYRIGAREQLLTFARILGAPMHVAASAEELQQVLDGLRDKRLVLIDTAGMSQRDVRLASQFTMLRVRGHRLRVVLALSAAADRGCLREASSVFAAASPQALIVTKIDEATTLGPLLSLALQSRLPIAYVADGQRVPEDLHLAGRRRAWLIQAALRLARDHAAPPEEADLAAQFASVGSVAHA